MTEQPEKLDEQPIAAFNKAEAKSGNEDLTLRQILAHADPDVRFIGPVFRSRWARRIFGWSLRPYAILRRELHDYPFEMAILGVRSNGCGRCTAGRICRAITQHQPPHRPAQFPRRAKLFERLCTICTFAGLQLGLPRRFCWLLGLRLIELF